MTKSLRHASIRPSHPGEIVADSIAETGVSKVAAAKALGIPLDRVVVTVDSDLSAVPGLKVENWRVLSPGG